MSIDPSGPVVLESVASSFEAETIAEALRAHGNPAEVFGGQLAQTVLWEIGYQAAAKVKVRRSDLGAGVDPRRGSGETERRGIGA